MYTVPMHGISPLHNERGRHMAAPKPNPTPAAQLVNNPAVINQVMNSAGPAERGPSASELFEQSIAKFTSDNVALLNERLTAVTKAKPEDFVEPEKDFWKPGKAGDFIQGVYAGSMKVGRLQQHAVLCQSKEDPRKSITMRLNGQHILTRELLKLTPGDGVRITYNGETTTKGLSAEATRLGLWTVSKLQLK